MNSYQKNKFQKKKNSHELKVCVTPLGGCGEIGKNMTIIENSNDIIVIDAGLMFPKEEMLGIDLIIPDISYLKRNRQRIRGIVLTHGHEDHIGALPYIIPEIDAPIYGTKLTLGLLESKLEEFEIKKPPTLICIKPKDKITLGSFQVEFFRVSHSIADGVGLAIFTNIGIIMHTGDFKVDQTPIDGELIDFHKIAEYSNQGILLLLSDSTNVERSGYSPSEKEVGEHLYNAFAEAKKRIIVTTFASNIHRIKQVIDCAIRYNRKVAITGMSMNRTISMAAKHGYLPNVNNKVMIPFEDVRRHLSKRIVIITTGSQGEPMSALSRMATNSHKHLKIEKDDMVIISARVIPGNESSIANTINNLFRLGAEVVYEKVSEVHVSGHASSEELKLMLNLARPKFFVPVHGEYRHLVHHTKLAQKVGIPENNIFILENGKKLELTKDKARIIGSVSSGMVLVDGKGVGDVGNIVLRDRQHLANDGMVIVLISIHKQSGKLNSPLEIISRGFVYVRGSEELFTKAKLKIEIALNECLSKNNNLPDIKNTVTGILKKFFYEEIERRPMILPLIVEI
ncbi:MAG: ribonuclease J [bacterium]|nr:ribonuclease J [bacterium]